MQTRYCRTVDDDKKIAVEVIFPAIRFHMELHGTHLGQLADAAQIIREFSQRILET